MVVVLKIMFPTILMGGLDFNDKQREGDGDAVLCGYPYRCGESCNETVRDIALVSSGLGKDKRTYANKMLNGKRTMHKPSLPIPES